MIFIMLSTMDGEMDVYKLNKMTNRKCRDLDHDRSIKSEYQRVSVKDEEIKKGRKTIFRNY